MMRKKKRKMKSQRTMRGRNVYLRCRAFAACGRARGRPRCPALGRKKIPELPGHALEIAERDLPGAVVVEQPESLQDLLAAVLLAHFDGHEFHEIVKRDGARVVAVYLTDHLLDLLLLGLEPERPHGDLQFLRVDRP